MRPTQRRRRRKERLAKISVECNQLSHAGEVLRLPRPSFMFHSNPSNMVSVTLTGAEHGQADFF